VQVRPLDGDIDDVRVTIPVKPPIEEMESADVLVTPAFTACDGGLALSEKSTSETVNVTVAEWVREPLDPASVTVKEPSVVPLEHASVEVPDAPSAIVVGPKVQERPVDGETDENRPTVPVKPLSEVTVTVELPELLCAIETGVGLATTVKSSTV
jgi:hypothetical protein